MPGQPPLVSFRKPLESKHRLSFSGTLDRISKKLLSEGGEMRSEVFEIDKASITVSDLKRFANFQIEIFLGHDAMGRLFLKTGTEKHVDFEASAESELFEICYGQQLFTAHNHPDDDYFPSLWDLQTFYKSESLNNFILSKDGICVMKKPTQEEIEQIMKLEVTFVGSNNEKKSARNKLLLELGVITKTYNWEDPEIENLVDIFKF